MAHRNVIMRLNIANMRNTFPDKPVERVIAIARAIENLLARIAAGRG